jgi:phospholipid transport system substrate-binding protein
MGSAIRYILKHFALLILAVAISGGALPAGFAPQPGWAKTDATQAAPVVEGFHHRLLAAARDGGPANYQARYAALDPAVRHAFDLTYISQAVLGSYWDTLTPAQRRTFTERFAQNTIATYAGRFDAYSGEKFTLVGEQTPRPAVRVVESDLTTGDGEKHRFTYVLRKTDDGWRIANILVDHISQIAVQRSQFTAILRDQGFDRLIARLDTLTSSMKQAS